MKYKIPEVVLYCNNIKHFDVNAAHNAKIRLHCLMGVNMHDVVLLWHIRDEL